MESKISAIIPRDGIHESPWQRLPDDASKSSSSSAGETFDCLIIGSGITGLTAALLLQNAGKRTMITEAHTTGFGTTGGTSAHINTFADTNYKEAESAFGEKGAQLFANAINEGLTLIKENVDAYGIACDYESKPGYIYAEDEKQAKDMDDIYEGTTKVGVPVKYASDVPIRVPYKKALLFEGQAQFHPLKYLQGLQAAYLAAGGIISENTKIDQLEQEGDLHIAKSGQKQISARKIIYATHIPPGINVFSFRCAPYRSYVVAVTFNSGDYPEALIYDMQEPYHYFRTHNIDGERLLLVGGNDHKTGHDDPEKAFADLEKYVRQYYDVSAVKYKWSSQYYVPVDGFPYVGQIPFMADGIYTATGYNGNGMMLGSVSGKILSDLVLDNENAYLEIFSPSRIKPIDGFTEFVKENADVAAHFIADRFRIHDIDSLQALKPGTGEVVEFEGRKVAAYKDDNGTVHALNPVCTHAHCIVNWNAEERSWDCPCHGARYDIDGKVLTGPADRDLQKITEVQDE